MNKTIFIARTNKLRTSGNTPDEAVLKLKNAGVRGNTVVSITEYIDNGDYYTFVPFSNLYTNNATLAVMLQDIKNGGII